VTPSGIIAKDHLTVLGNAPWYRPPKGLSCAV